MGKQSVGVCQYCEKQFSKMAIAKHLKSCPERSPDPDGTGRYFLIRAQGRSFPKYWLYIEASTNVTLNELDNFLRDIWLECCGHISLFTIDGQSYSSSPDKAFGDKSMNVKLEKVVHPGGTLQYEYDMGSTTELTLKVVEEYRGTKPAAPVIELMAQNTAPDIRCTECGNAEAVNVCSECQYDESGWLCEACSETHECGEDMLLPVVNSPRVGVCGYMG